MPPLQRAEPESPPASAPVGFPLALPGRANALPERMLETGGYADDGCDLHPSCLNCPRPVCWYELSPLERQAEHLDQTRAAAVTAALSRPRGETVADVAARFGVQRRTLYRWIDWHYDRLHPRQRPAARRADARAREAGLLLSEGVPKAEIARRLGLNVCYLSELLRRPAAGQLATWRGKAAKAGELRRAGWTHGEIAEAIGVRSLPTVAAYLRLPEAGPVPDRRRMKAKSTHRR